MNCTGQKPNPKCPHVFFEKRHTLSAGVSGTKIGRGVGLQLSGRFPADPRKIRAASHALPFAEITIRQILARASFSVFPFPEPS